MKKLATLLGAAICLKAMKKPKRLGATRVVNYNFIKSGCSGSCGEKCSCGKH